MGAERAAETLVGAVLLVFQAFVPGQHLGTVPGVILTWIVEVSGQSLEGDVSVLLDGYAFATTAEAAALGQHVNWTTGYPAFAVLALQGFEDDVWYFRHAGNRKDK